MTSVQGLGVFVCTALWCLELMCVVTWWRQSRKAVDESFMTVPAMFVFILSTLAWVLIVAHILHVW